MKKIYSASRKILADDVNMLRELRTSVFLREVQEAAIAHTEALGAGRDKTLDRGALWIVVRLRAEIARMPEYDEKVVLRSWPGATMHVLFPRYYELATEEGETCVRASAIWMLMDEKTRRMAFPEKYGVKLPAVRTGTELPLPEGVREEETEKVFVHPVRFSDVDINGHMNNSRYLDAVEDALGADFLSRNRLTDFEIEYKSEVKCGRRLTIAHSEKDGRICCVGRTGSNVCFRFTAGYEEREKK